MKPTGNASTAPTKDNRWRRLGILGIGFFCAVVYGALATIGGLQARVPLLLISHAVLMLAAVGAWWIARGSGASTRGLVLGAALVFRLVAALGEPALSDDVYRYVWDGRVQVHGVHPYRYAPTHPALADLRDDVWGQINHPELRTIYPPLAQVFFVVLAFLGAGVTGFKIAAGLLDFGVVLAVGLLLRRLRLPWDRVVLYAWNPLAVVETAGSGHYEPLGVLLVVAAAAWAVDRSVGRSALALAGAVQAKLLPVVLAPVYLRQWRARGTLWFVLFLLALMLPYAVTGPAIGSGLFEYAERWERNALLFAGIRSMLEVLDPTPWLKVVVTDLKNSLGEGSLPWEWIYRHVWPQHLARALAGALALGWVTFVACREALDPARRSLLALGGVLLLSPTLHPWYLLWALPFAVVTFSRGWLLLAALVPLAYVGGAGEVPWGIRLVEYLPPFALMGCGALRRRRPGRS